jgi:spore coat polysaccharide biosynthesis predicted glycosyltransferase SpsG
MKKAITEIKGLVNIPLPLLNVESVSMSTKNIVIAVGINDIKNHKKTIDGLTARVNQLTKENPNLKMFNPKDFTDNLKAGSKKWFVDEETKINIYENTDVDNNSLVYQNDAKFERVYSVFLKENV